jgi:tRNA U34 2-thiouridine synthase MnmA/TrmU
VNYKAVALLSGGLDSTLAILAILRQGIGVQAVGFHTPFDPDSSDRSSAMSRDSFSPAQRFGFDIKICSLGDQFLEMVKNPKHGYGKNMNPCIDCRILMLKEAKKVMDITGAEFILTGEVIGQRPMSQRKDMLYHIDREAGVSDLVVRPLSAKLLRMTIPEQKRIIDREKLYGFSGRSRKPQMELAKVLGLTHYPSPAGGCLLTEPTYAYRLKDLLAHDHEPSVRDIEFLKIGRHFRCSPSCKIVIGRDEVENEIIGSLTTDVDCVLRVEGYGSPVTLISGEVTGEALRIAASLCARYSDAKDISQVEVTVTRGRKTARLTVEPADNEMIDILRIEKRRKEKTAKV